MEVLHFFPVEMFQKRYLRFALPLLFFCVLLFLGGGGGWAASLTASSQKPMLELWVSPQMLLESEPQLVQGLVLTDPHTELLRVVCNTGEDNATVTQECEILAHIKKKEKKKEMKGETYKFSLLALTSTISL